MHRTESDNLIVIGGKNQYTDGPPGTVIVAADKNTIQEELAYLIEQNGLTLKKVATETNQQVYDAIAAMIASSVPNKTLVDFTSKNLIINVQSNTTVDANADELALLNSFNTPAFISDLDTTFDITTDLMAGTSEKASHWYQLWLSVSASGGAVTRMMVPDLESTCDGTSAGFLVDSGNTFATDGVKAGDIIFNLTDLTKTTVATTPTVDGANLAVTDDIFVNTENYKIRILSPTGLGSYKARVGSAFNNSSSNLDNSGYTQPEKINITEYSESFGDFSLSGVNWTTVWTSIYLYQVISFSGVPIWRMSGGIYGSLSVASTTVTVAFNGATFKTGRNQAFVTVTGVSGDPGNSTAATVNLLLSGPSTTDWVLAIDLELDKKPTFATRT